MDKKISVKICLGTTCFIMGSSNLQELIDILPTKYPDKVEVQGAPCLGLCPSRNGISKGPFVKIDDEVIQEATAEKIIKAIDEKLEKF